MAFMLHGDAVPVLQVGKAGTKSADCYSIQSLWVRGNSTWTKILMFAIFVVLANHNSYQEIWRVLTWSFFWLSVGVWPEVDMYGAPYGDDRPTERDLAGTPLAGGLFAVIYSLKGDLDYFAKCLKLRHYNRNEMCDFCCCTRVGPRGMLYNNFPKIACGK